MKPTKLTSQKITAFSLVELSVVLMVVAIIFFGVSTQAYRLMKQSKLSAARNYTKNSPVSLIPDLKLWLETTMSTSFLDAESDEGLKISKWKDLSPSKIHVSQGTANNQPIYKKNVINGLPALRFDGLASYLASTANASAIGMTGNPNFTIFIVANMTGGTDWGTLLGWGVPVTGNWLYAAKNGSNNQSFNFGFYGGSATSYNYTTNTVPAIHEWVRVGGSNNSATGNSVYFNGILQTPNPDTGVAVNLSDGTLKIGTSANTTYFAGSDIGEIIIFGKELNPTDRKNVEKYLGQKWGITVP